MSSTVSSSRPRATCPHCAAPTRVAGPAVWVRPAIVLTYVSLAGMLFGAALTGLGVTALGPLVALLGMPVLSTLGAMADALPTCEACRRYLPPGLSAE